MSSETELVEVARKAAAEMIEKEEARTRSRMLAYRSVAQKLGRSESWLRKFATNTPGIGLSISAFISIREAYTALCERIERDTNAQREARARLIGELNAATESGFRKHQSTSGIALGQDQHIREG